MYCLSPLQQGMLFHTLADSHRGVDIEQISITLRESLDTPRFVTAWQQVIERHAILRTQFVWEGVSEPQQVVATQVELPVFSADFTPHPSTTQQQLLTTYYQQDRQQPFDLAQAPLMRLAIFKLAAEQYHILWTFHHILLDGRSHPLVLRDLFAVYEGRELPPAPKLYQDYIDWRAGENFATSRRFWQQQLGDFTATTPIDFGPQAGTPDAETWDNAETVASAEVVQSLKTFAKQHNVTLHTLIQGAWALLLHHYSREEDVVFASTRACRHWHPDAGDMVGLFINTVPVRAQLDAQTDVVTFLQQLRQQQIVLREYEQTSLADIQRWSELKAGESLFDSLVVFDSATLNERLQALGGKWATREFDYHGQTNFPLTLMAYGGEQLLLRLEHDPKRFSAETANRILGHLRTLLTNLPHYGATPALQIPYLTDSEQAQFDHWNSTQKEPPSWLVHNRIALQAKRTPHRVALRFGFTELTYREVDRQSNQMAHYLQQLGVASGTLVAMYVERSAEMVIAMLGILKAGGTYIPLDPNFPRDRIAHMLADSAAPVIVTQSNLIPQLPPHNAITVPIDLAWDTIAAQPTYPTSSDAHGETLAYIIYTSGSTGKPKGVMVPHRALSNFLVSMQNEPGISADDHLLAVTTVSFDIAALEIFLPLIAGAELTLASSGAAASGASLRQLIERHGITLMQATPATWWMLLENEWQGHADLKLLCGGEPLPDRLAAQLLPRCAELWNMYGPTETTIWSTISQVDQGRITIGRPIDNTTVHTFDAQGNQVPVGVIGELCIGGLGVTHGYRNRLRLTAEKFIQGGELYRTGDLARFNPDGTLDCLGRIDHQVKIRGFRIELGEIESVLGKHEAIQAACVVARTLDSGSKQLVAYLIPEVAQTINVTTIRKFCKTKLPDYMVPSAYVTLDAFPLTNNGKINRLALPAPDGSRPELDHPFIAPRTATENAVAQIWCDVLMIEQAGVLDSFFDLGGDSLLVVRAVGRMRKQLAPSFVVHQLFELQTVEAVARVIDGRVGNSAETQPYTATTRHKLNGHIDKRAARRKQALQGAARRRKQVRIKR